MRVSPRGAAARARLPRAGCRFAAIELPAAMTDGQENIATPD
jgi:hypothetical protein